MKYRSDIDGLRAVAVLPVILFHAGYTIFTNGFLGVDVFFVISGFLISSILIKEIQTKGLDIIGFYERRARRILPALFFMIMVIIPIAWKFLYPGDMKNFAQSLAAVALFSSNILFWKEVGYFDTKAELKPLLHTWSLSIEEQFYFIFPVLLWILWRYRSHYIGAVLSLLTLASLTLAFWSSKYAPSAGFYLIGARAWELLIGAIGAYIVSQNKIAEMPNYFSKMTANIIAALAVFLVVLGYTGYGQNDQILIGQIYITVGTLLILLLHQDTFVSSFLSFKGFVAVGLISYSAYLWHQPLFAFAKVKHVNEVGYVMPSLILLTFLLAYLSWQYIEKPFRDKKRISLNKIAAFSLAGMGCLVCLGVVGHVKEGNVWAYSPDDLEVVGYKTKRDAYVWKNKRAMENQPFDERASLKVLVMGDSNSGDLLNSLLKLKNIDYISFSSITVLSKCGSVFVDPEIMIPHINFQDEYECREAWKIDSVKDELLKSADRVIIAAAWRDWQEPLIQESMAGLVSKYGDKFWLFGTKHQNFDATEILKIKPEDRESYRLIALTEDVQRNQKFKAFFGDKFIDPFTVMCDQNDVCPVFNHEGKIFTFDGFHLTDSGTDYLAQQIAPYVTDVLTPPNLITVETAQSNQPNMFATH